LVDSKDLSLVKTKSMAHRRPNSPRLWESSLMGIDSPYEEITRLEAVCGCSTVHKAVDKETKAVFVIKNFDSTDFKCYKIICNEIDVLKGLDHPNVIKIEYYSKLHDSFSMKYYGNGDFLTLLEKKPKGLSERLVKHYFRQLVSAVKYLTDKGIAHSDLKVENLLMGDDKNLVLADFGFSSPTSDRISGYGGSLSYMAPETLKEGKEFAPYDGTKADTYSLGIILFALLTAKTPWKLAQKFDKPPNKKMLPTRTPYGRFVNNIATFWTYVEMGFTPQVFTSGFKDLFGKLCAENPDDRISIHNVLDHEWLQSDNNVAAADDQVFSELSGIYPL